MAVSDPHRAVDRETAVAPGEEIAHRFLGDEALVHEHPQHLGLEEAFEVAGVEAWQVMEAPVRAEATIGDEEVDVWVKVEQLARGLEETHGAGCGVCAVEGDVEVEPESSPKKPFILLKSMKLVLILVATTALGALVHRWRHRKLLFWLTLPVFLYVALALVAGLLLMFVAEDTPPEGPALTPEDLRQWREAPDEEPADEKNGGVD